MTSPQDIEFGLDSFVPISVDESGRELSGDAVIRNTVEEAVLPDPVGVDARNTAEDYRQDRMGTAGSIILAPIPGPAKPGGCVTRVAGRRPQDAARAAPA